MVGYDLELVSYRNKNQNDQEARAIRAKGVESSWA
jgi:hypothetical protein